MSAEFHYAECHYAECHYGERHYAECHHAMCHGAKFEGSNWCPDTQHNGNVVMLSAPYKPFMLTVVMPSVAVPSNRPSGNGRKKSEYKIYVLSTNYGK